jgi:hypothetical protein
LLFVENDTDGTITVINLADPATPVSGSPIDLTAHGVSKPMAANLEVSPDGTFLYVVSLPATIPASPATQAQLSVITIPGFSVSPAVPIVTSPAVPVRVPISPDPGTQLGIAFTPSTTATSGIAFVTTEGASYAIDVPTPKITILKDSGADVIAGTLAMDPSGTFAYAVDASQSSTNAIVHRITTSTNATVGLTSVTPLCTFAGASAITAPNTPTARAYYTCQGSSFIQAIDTGTNSLTAVGHVSVGSGIAHPQGIAIPYDGVTAYVGLDDGTLVAVDIGSNTASPAVPGGTSLIGVRPRPPVLFGLAPTNPSVPTGETLSFTLGVPQFVKSATSLIWTVNGMAPVADISGNATVGTINSSGVYTAPQAIPTGGTVTVGVTSPEAPPVSKLYPLTTTVKINPSKLVFTTQPVNGTAGNALAEVDVSVEDANGTVVASDTSSVSITISSAGAFAPASTTSVLASGGVAKFTNLVPTKATTGPQSFTLTATDLSLSLTSPSSTSFTIAPGLPTQLVFTTQPGGGSGGAAWAEQPVVTVEDAGGNPVTSTSTQITLAITSTTGTAGATLTCTINPLGTAAGVASFAGCKIDKVGNNYTLTATSGALTVTSTSFNVATGLAAQMVFTTQPGSGTGGTPWAQQPMVTVEDAGGNTVTTDNTDAVTLTILNNGGSGALTCIANPVTVSSGVATFAGCKIDKMGNGYTLKATSGALTVTSSALNIATGGASQVAFTTQPGSGTGGTPWAQQPMVTVEDAGGNTVTTDGTDSVSLAILNNAGSGTLTCTTNPVTVSSGVATFAGCKIDKIGNGYTLKATSGVLTVTSSALNIATGGAAQVAFTTQPSSGTGGTPWAQQPMVTVEDAGGNAVTTDSTDPVSLAILNNAGSGTLTCTTNPVTVSSGVATFAGCKIDKIGNGYTLKATSGALTVTSSALNIATGGASQVAFTTQPGSGTGGTPWAQQPMVTVEDAGGNTVTTDSTDPVSLAILNNAGSGTLTCTTNPVTVSSGVATFAGCKIDKIGNGYTLKATSGVLTVTSSALNIATGGPAQVAFSTQPGSGTGGTPWAQQPAVAVEDAGGNTVTTDGTDPVSLAILNNAGSGTLTCTTNPVTVSSGVATFAGCKIDKIGNGYTLKASSGTLSQTTSIGLNIATGPAVQLAFTTQPTKAVASNAITPAVVVAVEDAGGNVVTSGAGSNASVTISSSAAPATPIAAPVRGTPTVTATGGVAVFNNLILTQVGTTPLATTKYNYTLTAASGSLSSANSSPAITIVPGTAAQLAFNTQPASGTTAGSVLAPVVVYVEDATGLNVVPSDSSTVNMAISTVTPAGQGGFTSDSTTSVAAMGGVASFANLKPTRSATLTLTASDGSLTSATSDNFVVVGDPAGVTPAGSPGSSQSNPLNITLTQNSVSATVDLLGPAPSDGVTFTIACAQPTLLNSSTAFAGVTCVPSQSAPATTMGSATGDTQIPITLIVFRSASSPIGGPSSPSIFGTSSKLTQWTTLILLVALGLLALGNFRWIRTGSAKARHGFAFVFLLCLSIGWMSACTQFSTTNAPPAPVSPARSGAGSAVVTITPSSSGGGANFQAKTVTVYFSAQ